MTTRYRTGDLMKAHRHEEGPWTIVTTNGSVNKSGRAVMGRGIAAQAVYFDRRIPRRLGALIRLQGNIPFTLGDGLVSLPVKHKWNEKADPRLIRESTKRLGELVKWSQIDLVRFPKVGCGWGGLDWDEVSKWWIPLADDLFPNYEVWDYPL